MVVWGPNFDLFRELFNLSAALGSQCEIHTRCHALHCGATQHHTVPHGIASGVNAPLFFVRPMLRSTVIILNWSCV